MITNKASRLATYASAAFVAFTSVAGAECRTTDMKFDNHSVTLTGRILTQEKTDFRRGDRYTVVETFALGAPINDATVAHYNALVAQNTKDFGWDQILTGQFAGDGVGRRDTPSEIDRACGQAFTDTLGVLRRQNLII